MTRFNETAFAWLRLHFAALMFAALTVMPAVFSVAAAKWQPPYIKASRYVEDERGRQIGLPQTLGLKAVFMAIGIGEYLLVTRRADDIITSPSSTNQHIEKSTLLAKAFPGVAGLRMPMSLVETGSINLETLLFYHPDVVVTWSRLADDFERVGFPVTGLGPGSSTDRIEQNTVLFSALIGEPDHAGTTIDNSLRERGLVAAEVEEKTKSKTRVLLLFPLGGGLWRVAYGYGNLIDEAGGRSLGRNMAQPSMNAEQLLLLAPEVVLLIGDPEDDAPETFMATPALAGLPAIKARRVYKSPHGVSGYMSTLVELPIYTRWLAEILHPVELDHHLRAFARNIYQTNLGVTPDEDELDDALSVNANVHSAFAPIFIREH